MLAPEQIERAGEMVGAVYREMEAAMLDHLASVMASGGGITGRAMAEIALLAQSQTAELRRIVERHAATVDAAVLATAEEFLELSDANDMERAGGAPMWPRQVDATVAGIARILARDNLQMVEGAKEAFLRASARAVTEVNTGLRTAEQALHRAVRSLERQGIDMITYQNAETGRVTVRNKADVAVRRHVRTQMAQDGMRMTLERMERLDVELVEVSSHPGARPEHAEWQGMCYSMEGQRVIDGTLYPDLRQATGYGTVSGLGGANCRHSFGPYRHGAPRMYDPDPQPECGVTSAELYEMEQGQRYRERRIREAKRELKGAQILYDKLGSPDSRDELMRAKTLLRNRQDAMRAYIDACNAKGNGRPVLIRHPDREWAGDMPKATKVSQLRSEQAQYLESQSAGKKSARTTPVHAKPRFSLEDYLYGLEGERRPMSFKKADGGNVNPNYGKSKGFGKNCQTCAAAYVARRLGWDVIAKPRRNNQIMDALAGEPWKIWIDPGSFRVVDVEHAFPQTGHEASMFLENHVRQGEIHSLAFRATNAKGRAVNHVVNVERKKNGDLFIYDPQTAIIIDSADISTYLKGCWEMNLFRCDDAILDVDIAKEVFQLGF